MADLTEKLKANLLIALERVEHSILKTKLKVKDASQAFDPINIMPYHGFGNPNYVFVKGRVLEDEKVKQPHKGDGILHHLKDTYKRYESDEIPGIKIKASFAGQEVETETDEEGYFTIEFKSDTPIDFSTAGNKVKLQLLGHKTDKDRLEAEANVFAPGKDVEFGIISDIDDTVLVSDIKHFLGRLKLMLMKNAVERSPFPGVAGLLRALCKGSDAKGNNPLFFVSGSEWNLYDLLISFFRSHDIPEGPLLLRDKGIGQGSLKKHLIAYKLDQIRHILNTFPDLKFICIGDSGEHDPEIYEKVVQEFPGRILGIYIRDVSAEERDKEVKSIAARLKKQHVEMVLAEETLSVAKHAAKMGWINQNQLEDVRKACEADKQAKQTD
ncbi:DUF2183 domain-containing protein [Pontibacter sp. KCTC 32443]|uniref:App1 family protein n=1 Tax=Pontibacter TaxID=323449 RepID=UPI00164D904A|nr:MULTISPECIES: phosphatase domain-containing protein [Pontibacter]MBC5775848.1 DUF2183 domain-containing protein [Pontibacter sp. KCTC 32443]